MISIFIICVIVLLVAGIIATIFWSIVLGLKVDELQEELDRLRAPVQLTSKNDAGTSKKKRLPESHRKVIDSVAVFLRPVFGNVFRTCLTAIGLIAVSSVIFAAVYSSKHGGFYKKPETPALDRVVAVQKAEEDRKVESARFAIDQPKTNKRAERKFREKADIVVQGVGEREAAAKGLLQYYKFAKITMFDKHDDAYWTRGSLRFSNDGNNYDVDFVARVVDRGGEPTFERFDVRWP